MANRPTDFWTKERKLPRGLRFLEILFKKREPSPRTEAIGDAVAVIVWIAAGVAVAVWLFVLLIGPLFEASQATVVKSDKAANSVAVAVWNALPGFTARIDRRLGDNLDLYVQRRAFENIPYPDRNQVVEEIGRAWCNNIDYPWVPRVSFFDIQRGKRLATHICALGKLKDAWKKSSTHPQQATKAPAPEQLVIISAEFGLLSLPRSGSVGFWPSTKVPLKRDQSYGWIIRLQTSKQKVKWREEVSLPSAPESWGVGEKLGLHKISEDRKVAITEGEVTPDRGFIFNAWTIAPGDPKGRYVIRLSIEGRFVKEFQFDVE